MQAGIPIVTKQGVNGGISIIEDYKIDKTIITQGEMQDILAGLRSLDSVNGTNRYGQLMEKLSVGSSDFMVGNQSVLIDLSSWYKDSLAPKIELIRTAIDKCRKMEFVYYSPKGESVRCIEPYYLIFRWSSWYVWGCKASGGDLASTDRSGTESFKVQQDGKLLFQADYTDKENLITWLLSFREKVELLEPEEIREELKVSIERMKKKYEGNI